MQQWSKPILSDMLPRQAIKWYSIKSPGFRIYIHILETATSHQSNYMNIDARLR